jgi:hypothetical protein
MKSLLNLFFMFSFLGCMTASARAENSPGPERTIQLSFLKVLKKEPGYAFYFLKHLDRWYLQLTPDHKKFILLNAQELQVGTKIENEEESHGQHVRHLYTVTKFDQGAGVFQMESPVSRVVVWGIFRLQNKTDLTIRLKDNGDGTYFMTADLRLVFASEADKDKAVFFKVDQVWKKHMYEEMTKAVSIVESLSDIKEDLW